MSKKQFKRTKPAKQIADNSVSQAVIYSVSMRLMTAGGAVLRDSFGFTDEQIAAWSQETIRRANPDNAKGKFIADA